MSEESEHRAICNYIRYQYPDVIFMSDLSGVKMSIGLAVKVKYLKSDRGIPDLIVLKSNSHFFALMLEIKKSGTKLKKMNGQWASKHLEEQAKMLQALSKQGYMANFAIGFEQAKKIIDTYMKLN